ncbi:leucine--tRNA ligase [Dermatophilus congolensis]|uniref:Leucine--tRNA ligase n=1 Tax=Dermatophilus congolensis TaxID=1863 RepID=A0A239VJL1_9MICO|nr:leucine--tRNA ligase [Dermatophilus congolensis]MBO3129227.1 leucine--tRNA ligase [Dermatophilus congolensis]MBO3132141.1 leucine--tRNA ligase [Dermatophilus congolensis]MBO3133703.1 leucine--tRNA ligase [Dermatophilus congolensis]MBO3135936.1 leucine--tRNA ligase [Dermatophilus congolensis]MBO3138176.1 leucine--tRNA ligase [Dermatophilus congolensis]
MSESASGAGYRYTAEVADRIERHWQDVWETEGTYAAANPAGPWADSQAAKREPLYVLDMFPYPSGAGLHVGHPLGYIATDAFARFQRMTGKNVLHTLGYDAFGLPAEQYAIQTGQHPRVTTENNIANMRRQLRRLGLGHDTRRSVATTDVEFYRWTQWIFLQLFNAWFDPQAPNASNGKGKARPISELEAEFADGTRPTPDGRPWGELARHEQREILDQYRLAYVSSAPVNWCPGLGTVLANEEVTAEGRSDIGNYPVFKRNMRQWMMRITTYADRLLEDLDRVDWPEPVKLMQRNWIGRSTGATVRFDVPAAEGATEQVEVFTTRPDTLFGATFMVLAPEHPLVEKIVPATWPEGTKQAWKAGAATPSEGVSAYIAAAASKTEMERQAEGKEKTGVFTGAFAINPVDGRALPVFIADYVLMGYGTGAIMAVPAEDERDFAFASAFDIDVIRTIEPPAGHPEDQPYTGDGVKINSTGEGIDLNGMSVPQAKAAMITHLEAQGIGEGTTTYKLRDWLFSRQRYWGEPFPIVYDEFDQPVAVPESMLPVQLPEVDDYSPQKLEPEDETSQPVPPLARAEEWANVQLDLGDGPKMYRRELNVMPQWAGSCWYEMRYLDPANTERFVDPQVERYWMGPRATPVEGAPAGLPDVGGVDLYVGGVEHAVLHLLYARFWHKVLFDLGHTSSAEPFRRLYNQGYIQAYAFRDQRGQIVPAAEITESVQQDGTTAYLWNGQEVVREYGKMGKSLKNVVSPDEMYDQYGADTFRVYEMSMGPLEASKPWETRAVVGSQRFLQRVWRNVIDEETGEVVVVDEPMDEDTARAMARAVQGVRADYAGLRFNTAIAKLIEFNNVLTKLAHTPREAAETLVVMLAPVAPHIAEELWHRLGHSDSVVYAQFPEADEALLAAASVTAVIQVLGKVRARIEVDPSICEADLEKAAFAEPRIAELIEGKTVRKVIVRAPNLVNIVAQ